MQHSAHTSGRCLVQWPHTSWPSYWCASFLHILMPCELASFQIPMLSQLATHWRSIQTLAQRADLCVVSILRAADSMADSITHQVSSYMLYVLFLSTHTHTHTIQWQCNRWLSWQSSIQVYQWARCWFSAMKTPRSPCSTSLNSPRTSNRGNSFQKYRLSRVLSLSLSLSRALNNIYTSSWIFLILTLETLEMWRHLKCGARKVSSKAWIIKV